MRDGLFARLPTQLRSIPGTGACGRRRGGPARSRPPLMPALLPPRRASLLSAQAHLGSAPLASGRRRGAPRSVVLIPRRHLALVGLPRRPPHRARRKYESDGDCAWGARLYRLIAPRRRRTRGASRNDPSAAHRRERNSHSSSRAARPLGPVPQHSVPSGVPATRRSPRDDGLSRLAWRSPASELSSCVDAPAPQSAPLHSRAPQGPTRARA